MPTYSSDEFYQQWRFSLTEDFQTGAGQAYPYAAEGLKGWGDEIHSIPHPSNDGDRSSRPKAFAVSHDGRFLAVAIKPEIQVYNTQSYEVEHSLRGVVGDVTSMAFRPGKSNVLVSSATCQAYNRSKDPSTIFWDLDTYQSEPLLDPNNTFRISLAAVKSITTEVQTLSSSAMLVTADEEASMAKSFETQIISLLSEKLVKRHKYLKGRIHQSFNSNAFSPSGHAMFYFPPGNRRSNGHDENWKLHVYSPDREEDMFTLSGHTDSIMWTGFNHDESLIGTCGWDKSIRIWNATDGSQKYKFDTEGQNWAGGFSPNGKYFVGTCGRGSLRVYDLNGGTEHMKLDMEKRWSRAVAWHPSSSWFAVGGQHLGRLDLVDINTKQIFQRRRLGTELSRIEQDRKPSLGSWLELSTLHILDSGRKVVFMVGADGSADVYDVEKECKWRFARAGVMNGPDDTRLVTSKPGHAMRVWEDRDLGVIKIATIDGDAIRFWEVPLTS